MAQTGGKFYGQGVYGRVTDTECLPQDPETFCEFLKNNKDNITKIVLNGRIHLSKKYVPALITKMLEAMTHSVTKTFLKPQGFYDEIAAIEKIVKLIAKRLHTLTPGFKYHKLPIYGVVIHFNDGSTTYHVFNEKCSTTTENFDFTETTFKQFISDIDEILTHLHKAGFNHNDVKPDNIIYCENDKRFKLIDWNQAAPIKKVLGVKKIGSIFYNHPLKFYVNGLPQLISKNNMELSIFTGDYNWEKHTHIYEFIKSFGKDSFDYVLSKEESINNMHKTYSKHFDGYSFAISIMFLAEKNNIPVPKDKVLELLQPFIDFLQLE